MAKLRRLTIMGLIMWGLGSGEVSAEDGIDFEVGADFFDKYIWRGQNLVDDPVFQTGIRASYGRLTATVWGNLDLTNVNGNSGDFSEVDYSLGYSGSLRQFEALGYSLGLIYYDFPGTVVKDTTEVYWGLTLDVPANPSVTFYHDVDEADGTYIALAVDHSIEQIAKLGPETLVRMEIGARVGWGSASYDKYYWGIEQSKLNDLALFVSFPVDFNGWTIAPSVNYVTLLSDDIRDSDAYGTDSDFFFAGLSCSKKF